MDWADPLEKERLPIPVFWPGESSGLYLVHGVAKSQDTTEQLSLKQEMVGVCSGLG